MGILKGGNKMKKIEDLRYQTDVTTTLLDNYDYLIWIDTEYRMIETDKGKNRQIVNRDEINKYCNLYHYPKNAVEI
jgi:hypothetical protein